MFGINTQKTGSIVALLIGIISLYYYHDAPIHYSYVYCTLMFVLFSVDVFFVLWGRVKNRILSFELIFTIGYAFVNYAYPMFYYKIDPYFSLFALDYPEDYINKGIALSTVAYSFLAFGFFRFPVSSIKIVSDSKYVGNAEKKLSNYTMILLVVMLATLIPIALSGNYDMNWGFGGEIRGILESLIFYTLFQKFYRRRGQGYKTLLKGNYWYFALIIAYAVISTVIGNRGNIIRIGFLILLLYNDYMKKISNLGIALVLFAGLILMFVRGAYRDSGGLNNVQSNYISILDVGRDLTINNRSQYVLMEYADKKGFSYGRNFLGSLLSPIPYAQSTLLSITGWKVNQISSGDLVTDDYFSHNKSDSFGLGTNIVGDVYLAFGVFGVVILFFILGYFISKVTYLANRGYPLYYLTYAILLINSVIWIRSDFFKPFQMVLWSVALYYIFDKRLFRK